MRTSHTANDLNNEQQPSRHIVVLERVGPLSLTSILVKYANHIVSYVQCQKSTWFLVNNERSKRNLPLLKIPFKTVDNNFDCTNLLEPLHREIQNTYIVCIYARH